MKRVKLDGVPIRVSNDLLHCDLQCPILTFDGFTVCGLEKHKKNRKSRYDPKTNQWRRCRECFRLERKGK